MRNGISIDIKKKCCEMKSSGLTSRQIYDTYFKSLFEKPMTHASFKRELNKWCLKTFPDTLTLDAGTYEGFTAHGATVQVSGNGEIVQAWIKQSVNDIDPEEFIRAIKESVEPYEFEFTKHNDSSNMLEIPLFDMHWGIAFFDYYEPLLKEVCELIRYRHWAKIVIPFGQDFFHNDSIINGQTTKGTAIEKVDMVRAVKDGLKFIYAIIDLAIEYADEVKVLYTPGNHDRSISWMLMQTLLERYGESVVDDSLEFRKVFSYGTNAIMVAHGDSKRATSRALAHIFPVTFPEAFANAKIREVHAGHLHSEAEADIFGVMVRRLSSGNKTDTWSDKEDFIGAHKRFMLFEWAPDKLKAIYYV